MVWIPEADTNQIEISPNARAKCQEKECKDNGVKLKKGEIRFGTWVEIMDHSSWRWKHWLVPHSTRRLHSCPPSPGVVCRH